LKSTLCKSKKKKKRKEVRETRKRERRDRGREGRKEGVGETHLNDRQEKNLVELINTVIHGVSVNVMWMYDGGPIRLHQLCAS
jgi:hypothetical protein